MLRQFLGGLAAHLAPGGEGWLVLSDIAEHLGLRSRPELLTAFEAAGLAGRRPARCAAATSARRRCRRSSSCGARRGSHVAVAASRAVTSATDRDARIGDNARVASVSAPRCCPRACRSRSKRSCISSCPVGNRTARAWSRRRHVRVRRAADASRRTRCGGSHRRSAGAYRRALVLAPANANLHHNLGVLLGRRGDLPGAERHLVEAERLQPASSVSPFALGHLCFRAGRLADAARAFERALRERPIRSKPHAIWGSPSRHWESRRVRLPILTRVRAHLPFAEELFRAHFAALHGAGRCRGSRPGIPGIRSRRGAFGMARDDRIALGAYERACRTRSEVPSDGRELAIPTAGPAIPRRDHRL